MVYAAAANNISMPPRELSGLARAFKLVKGMDAEDLECGSYRVAAVPHGTY
jgi:hypothetical protein